MLIPCEVAVKSLLPPTRAALANALINKRGFKQVEAAKLLEISQPAISLYNRKMRGKALNLESDKEIKALIEQLADSIAEKRLSREEFILKFCEICKTARAKGLLCQMHKTLDPKLAIEKCNLCKKELKCL
ncbi:MAG: hypothetical protein RMJ15_04685 [Nitrososphaerota archaeon]|nr:hypothetical protein [Candidatus Bathyarchaeota archaeon]MDW8023016.1 hypothetical protein [Nitrososphaerota archaeon]